MKVLVTGAAGFIGGHLVQRLLADDNEVVAADKSPRPSWLPHSDKVTYHREDLRNPMACDHVVKGVDAVFHFAGQSDIQKGLKDHFTDMENNLITTVYLLESMEKFDVRDMALASSASVYGEVFKFPTPEETDTAPLSFYAASKVSSESFSRAYSELFSRSIKVFRLANPIGERDLKGVVWNFVHSLQKDRTVSIYGTGLETRGFFYVKDCVDGIVTGFMKDYSKFSVYNVGPSLSTTVMQLAKIVISEMDLDESKVKFVHKPPREGDIRFSNPSPKKLNSLGWKCETTSEEAIRRTVRWTREHL